MTEAARRYADILSRAKVVLERARPSQAAGTRDPAGTRGTRSGHPTCSSIKSEKTADFRQFSEVGTRGTPGTRENDNVRWENAVCCPSAFGLPLCQDHHLTRRSRGAELPPVVPRQAGPPATGHRRRRGGRLSPGAWRMPLRARSAWAFDVSSRGGSEREHNSATPTITPTMRHQHRRTLADKREQIT